MTPLRVSVPGSTSNLGPGFDVLGMAVDRRLEVRLELRGAGPPQLERHGTLAGVAGEPKDDLVMATLLDEAPELGDSGVSLRLESAIPVGKGLGSSAAARVAGHVLARLVRGEPVDRSAILDACTAAEGHPDNVAPAVHGGLLASRVAEGGRVEVRALPVAPQIGWGWIAPGPTLSTDAARRVLPVHWERGSVVRTLSRLAFLLPALADPGRDGERLRGLMEDELHLPVRLALIPGGESALRTGLEAGAWGVTISGAGSGLLVAGDPAEVEGILDRMREAFDAVGAGPVTSFPLQVDPDGVHWESGPEGG